MIYTPFPGVVSQQLPNIIPYTPGAVHFDGVTYLQCDSLVLPEIGIQAGTDGFGLTIAFWAKTVWDTTFTPGNIPVFVVDPVFNYGPSIIAQAGANTIFVAGTSQGYWYSFDGVTWTAANLPSISNVVYTETDYLQGMWAGAFHSGVFPTEQFGWITTFDGINWTLAIESTEGDPIVLTFSGNDFVFTPVSGPDAPVTITNPNPSSPALKANDMDATQTEPLADPSQAAGATIPDDQITVTPLPYGMMAIRRGQGGTPFQYTQTPITNSIVNSGTTWPGANWVTPSGWSNVSGGADIFYGQIGKTGFVLQGGKPNSVNVQTSIVGLDCDDIGEITANIEDRLSSWVISSTAGPTASYGKPYKDFIVNGPLWQEPVWMHFMFTFDSDLGHANIYINGIQADLSGSSVAGGTNLGLSTALPFVTRLNQKMATIGGDSLGSFFIGDIADFSVWNVNLGGITVITNDNRQGLPSPYNIFLDPSNNSPTSPSFQASMVHYLTSNRSGLNRSNFVIRQAVAMLTGNAIDFPQNTLGSAQPFRLARGFLTSAATVPLFISAP